MLIGRNWRPPWRHLFCLLLGVGRICWTNDFRGLWRRPAGNKDRKRLEGADNLASATVALEATTTTTTTAATATATATPRRHLRAKLDFGRKWRPSTSGCCGAGATRNIIKHPYRCFTCLRTPDDANPATLAALGWSGRSIKGAQVRLGCPPCLVHWWAPEKDDSHQHHQHHHDHHRRQLRHVTCLFIKRTAF